MIHDCTVSHLLCFFLFKAVRLGTRVDDDVVLDDDDDPTLCTLRGNVSGGESVFTSGSGLLRAFNDRCLELDTMVSGVRIVWDGRKLWEEFSKVDGIEYLNAFSILVILAARCCRAAG